MRDRDRVEALARFREVRLLGTSTIEPRVSVRPRPATRRRAPGDPHRRERAMHDDDLERVKTAANLDQAYVVTTIKGYRSDYGPLREITVEIWDAGASSSHRYHVRVRDKHGRFTTGTPAAEIALALREVHWHELDRPEP